MDISYNKPFKSLIDKNLKKPNLQRKLESAETLSLEKSDSRAKKQFKIQSNS